MTLGSSFLLPRRGFLAGALASLAAPFILRATSLDMVRGAPFGLDPAGALVERATAHGAGLEFQYWVAHLGNLRSMTARDILAAPLGTVRPWVAPAEGLLRPVREAEKGLAFAGGRFLQLPGFAGDPDLVRLNGEREVLMRQLRAEQERVRAAQLQEQWDSIQPARREANEHAERLARAAITDANREKFWRIS